MIVASTTRTMSPGLLKVMERAKRDPEGRFHSLAHLIDVEALDRAYRRARKGAAPGVDGVTKEQYGQHLQGNLQGLHQRLRERRYRHQPIRRVHIPKGEGKTRPIGIAAFEDKVVQDAIREVLEAIYEQDFLDVSFGFRPKRNAHDAMRAIHGMAKQGWVSCILEADIVSFFDSIDRTALMEMLQVRVADGSLLRLIGKCLHVGVLDGEEYSEPDVGTVQGSSLSPMLGNIYLHHVLDLWFERDVKPRMRGRAWLCRYADDFAIAFELEEDARRVMEVLPKRLEKYGLTLHPDKTRIVPFRKPPSSQDGGKGPGTLDFLGFTWFWRRSRWGTWYPACKTRRARLSRAIQSVYEFCRSHRHDPVKVQHAALVRRIRGHFNYFGVNGNAQPLALLVQETKWIWHKWLRRRSQRTRMTGQRFMDLLRRFPLPRPRICVQIWGS